MAGATHDVIILGAGGAGLFCAGVAVRRGRRVLVLDHAASPGEKIRISGGGRCNFTNRHVSAADFLSVNPHFAKSALARFTPADFIALVDAHGIAWHEKAGGGAGPGQLFCDGSARQIIDMLLAECRAGQPGGAELRLGTAITSVTHGDGAFTVTTNTAEAFTAPRLVVATGGPSIPKLGATGFAYDLARRFNIPVIPPRAALVPLTFDATDASRFAGLAGVSLPDATVACGRTRFRAGLLFTHRGLSGPAILQVSSYWEMANRAQHIAIDLCPGTDLLAALKAARLAHPRQELATALERHLPARLAARLAELAQASGRLADLNDARLAAAAALAKDWTFMPGGSEGFAKAEVTLGGIDTAALSSRSMEAAAVPGLYFIGEAVDVTGHLGGFNFQWAWASGSAAGEAV